MPLVGTSLFGFLVCLFLTPGPWQPGVTVSHPVLQHVGDVDTADVWHHPVDAPIVDFFRPPSGPYGPGNRGLEYGTVSGQSVVAVAAGVVVFSGQVGVNLFVVVAHSPQLRSTYAYLDQILVSAGDAVVQGQQLATANPGFHLTARFNGRYVDPLRYMNLRWLVRLVVAGEVGGRALSIEPRGGPQ